MSNGHISMPYVRKRKEGPLRESASRMRHAAGDFLAALIPDRLLERIAERAPQRFSTLNIPLSGSDSGIPMSDYWTLPLQDAYEVQAWVYVCCNAVGRAVAQIPVEPYEEVKTAKGGTRRIKIADHPVSKLFRRPNPWMPYYHLRLGTCIFQETSGNAYWYIARKSSGEAGWIIPLRPDRVQPVPDPETFVKGYIYTLDGRQIALPPDDVMHFKYFATMKDHLGQGTLEAARKTLVDDVYAQKYNTAFFKNSAMPKGALGFDQVLGEEEYPRIRAMWDEIYGGGPDSANKIGVFGKGAKWLNIGMTQKDMDFVLTRKMNRLTLAAVFGVKPTMINTYEDVNYNTAKQQKLEFWHDTGIPKIIEFTQWLDVYSYKLLTPRSPLSRSQDFYFGYDLSRVPALVAEAREQQKSDNEAVKAGIFTINKVLEKRNEEPVPWGDVWWAPSNMLPISGPESPLLGKAAKIKAKSGTAAKKELKSPRTREQRLAVWKGFVVHEEYYERLVAGLVRNWFKDQRELVLKKLKALYRTLGVTDPNVRLKRNPTKVEIEGVLFDVEEAAEKLGVLSNDLYERMAQAGGDEGFVLAEVAGTFDLDDPKARARLLAKKQKFATKINETTWTKLQTSLTSGMELGETLAEMSARVETVMKSRIASSKLTIARTEVIGVMNGATVDGFKQTGVVEGKEWITAGDGNEREDHADMDGQIADLDGYFTVPSTGDRLEYPGDPGGDAAQIINCRCTVLPKLKEKPNEE